MLKIACLLLLPAFAAPPENSDAAAALNEAVPRLMQEADVPGLQIALIRDGKTVWNRAFGFANGERQEPLTEETLLQAASLSKPVFAYAVLKLFEQGRIELDRSLSDYLPDYIDDPRVKAITARHVMTHSCGFPNWRPRGGELKIIFNAGERFSYSGEGFVYLQNVVERITGKPLDDFVREMVFEPLGMKDSSYVWQERFEGRTARGHDFKGKAHPLQKRTVANAAASLYTTSRDYARFVEAILNREGLKEETFDEMLSPQIRVDERADFKAAQQLAWGLGLGLQTNGVGTAFWHWGDNGDFKCYVIAYPRQKSGLVYFTNSENGLSIPAPILQAGMGGEQPALDWLAYEPYDGPSRAFMAHIGQGLDSALQSLRDLQGTPRFKERWINRLGYSLLRQRKLDAAIGVFELNTQAFPDSYNVWDSLAEACLEKGEREKAIEYYEKSVQLNPESQSGIQALKKLREGK